MGTTEKPQLEDLPNWAVEMYQDVKWMKSQMLAQSEQKKSEEVANVILTVAEAAELTKYSEQTIRTKVMRNEIPSFKQGGKRLFKKSELLQWIDTSSRN